MEGQGARHLEGTLAAERVAALHDHLHADRLADQHEDEAEPDRERLGGGVEPDE